MYPITAHCILIIHKPHLTEFGQDLNELMFTGVALIAKFCINIAFSGAVRILAASLCHQTQNDWTSIQQVTAHWWLQRHSTLDQFANSVWSQPWLHTPPRHYKSSQWRAESGWRNKCANEPNLYEPVSGRIIGFRISLASEKSRILLNWSVIISGQSTGHDPKHGIWNNPMCLV